MIIQAVSAYRVAHLYDMTLHNILNTTFMYCFFQTFTTSHRFMNGNYPMANRENGKRKIKNKPESGSEYVIFPNYFLQLK